MAGFIMDAINATEAKREFGEVLLKAQRAPISIKKMVRQ
jgi:hypothetical protein